MGRLVPPRQGGSVTSTHHRLPTTPSMRTWNVVVQRDVIIELGQVQEVSEELARCAALCKFGIVPGDGPVPMDLDGHGPRGILEDDDFSVYPA